MDTRIRLQRRAVGIAEDVIALTGVAEWLAMRLLRFAVRLQLLESGRRDRHDPKFLVFVPRGKKQPQDAFYPPFVQRHTDQAVPVPRTVHRRILKKRRGAPESKKHRAKLLRIVLVLGLSDAIATATTQKILISVHRAHLWTERLAGFFGRKR